MEIMLMGRSPGTVFSQAMVFTELPEVLMDRAATGWCC